MPVVPRVLLRYATSLARVLNTVPTERAIKYNRILFFNFDRHRTRKKLSECKRCSMYRCEFTAVLSIRTAAAAVQFGCGS